jgi:glycosyltransferase involved in cell wall biosynthesis
MRIAVLEPAGHGGLLHYSVQLAEGLAARGHAVDIIAPRGNELVGRVRHAHMRPILPVPLRSTAPARSRAAYTRRRAGVAVRLLSAWARMLWETRPGRYDAVLHGADVGLPPIALATLLMSAIPRRPLLIRIAHNVRAFNRRGGEDLFDPSPVSGALLRRLYPRFDLVLVHGERSRGDFEQEWGPARLAVIPHGDERIFADGPPPPPSTEERVLFFGDWRKVKGLAVLMDAFDELVRRRPGARLTVAGTPIPEDWDPKILREWARAHDGRVELVDRYVPMSEVAPTFARARVVTTPYLTGYQSGVIHLAATMARPVVTSDVGDLASAVSDGVTGRVVPPRDPVRLADALEEILADPELAARMGDAARRTVLSGSSWERVAERVEEELVPLLEARRGADR